MKLLFDQNISFRILPFIKVYFPDSVQVHQLHLTNFSDKQIWDFAKSNSYTIVTFDSDFNDFATLFGHSPKIIWLRLGNTTTKALSEFLLERHEIISDSIHNPKFKEVGCLEFDSITE